MLRVDFLRRRVLFSTVYMSIESGNEREIFRLTTFDLQFAAASIVPPIINAMISSSFETGAKHIATWEQGLSALCRI